WRRHERRFKPRQHQLTLINCHLTSPPRQRPNCCPFVPQLAPVGRQTTQPQRPYHTPDSKRLCPFHSHSQTRHAGHTDNTDPLSHSHLDDARSTHTAHYRPGQFPRDTQTPQHNALHALQPFSPLHL